MKNREKPDSTKNSQYGVRKIPIFFVKKPEKLTTFRHFWTQKTGKIDHFSGPVLAPYHKTPYLRFWDPLEFAKTRKFMKITKIGTPSEQKPDFWRLDRALRDDRPKNDDQRISEKK